MWINSADAEDLLVSLLTPFYVRYTSQKRQNVFVVNDVFSADFLAGDLALVH